MDIETANAESTLPSAAAGLAGGLRTPNAGKAFASGIGQTFKGKWGRAGQSRRDLAAKIDRRRLGALAVLILEGVLVSAALPYNYDFRPRNFYQPKHPLSTDTGSYRQRLV